jgi:hypothetical protein
MKDVQLRRVFERECRKRGLPVYTVPATYRYFGVTEQLFEFFKLGIEYADPEWSHEEGWDG